MECSIEWFCKHVLQVEYKTKWSVLNSLYIFQLFLCCVVFQCCKETKNRKINLKPCYLGLFLSIFHLIRAEIMFKPSFFQFFFHSYLYQVHNCINTIFLPQFKYIFYICTAYLNHLLVYYPQLV